MNKKWIYMLVTVLLMMVFASGCGETGAEEGNNALSVEAVESTEETTPVAEKATPLASTFISVEAFEQLSKEDIILLDARGQEAYDKGHIEGALATSWQALSDMTPAFATSAWGTVKDSVALSEALSQLGIDGEKTLVVYADTQKGWGEDGRIYWTLNMAGIDNVKILDGGINHWIDQGGVPVKEASTPIAVDFKITALDTRQSIDTETLSKSLLTYKIIDTRDFDEYEGAIKYGEARGGHLPGAIHLPYKSLLKENGQLKEEAELIKIFEAVGLQKGDKIVTYCTAGIRSAHVAIILDLLGYQDVANYDASYYIWANTPELKLGKMVKGAAYNFYTPEDLKMAIESKLPVTIVDIQVAEEFDKHHIVQAIETNAYPVKTNEEMYKLNEVITTIKASDTPAVIVCPRGGGGAQRAYKYMVSQGIVPAQLYILEKGQEGWPYEDLLAK